MNIIVIEDHDSLRIVTVNTLKKHGYSVIGLSCAEDLDDTAGRELADIFIIDLNLPNEDGISLTKRIRKANPLVGVIMLTARNRLEDKILGYESGADIYLTKPIALVELLAAISSLFRRVQIEKVSEARLILDSVRCVLQSDTAEIILNPAEVILLQVLARAKNQQLEYWQLIEAMGECLDTFDKSHLGVKIHRLRHKIIQIGGNKNAIKSRHQKGYQLCIRLIVR